MGFIRVLTNPDRCMQRFGFLKHIVQRASRSATNNLSTLGKNLISSVSQKVSATTLTPNLQEYIKTVLTDPIHRNIRNACKAVEENPKNPIIHDVETQDIYLADLDSRRGRIVKEDWRKYPYLALDLGMLRKGTYSLLVRGQSFLSLVPEEEKKAFATLNINSNPLRLTLPQRFLLLFSFIERDGDVLMRLYEKLLPLAEPFTDRDAGDYLPEIYRAIAKESRAKVRSGDDLLRIQKLMDTADKIEAWKGKPYTGEGARGIAIKPRLEPFVDLGLLSKPDPFAYRYQVTDATKTFLGAVVNSMNNRAVLEKKEKCDACGIYHQDNIHYFLHHSFFEATNKAFNLNGKHQTDRETILPAIQKAYDVLKNPLGYVPILEVALLAGIYSITESGIYFEISAVVDTLKSLQKEKPELVRFNVDRWGALTFVKFNSDIMKVVRM